jgi:hypothetical protein
VEHFYFQYFLKLLKYKNKKDDDRRFLIFIISNICVTIINHVIYYLCNTNKNCFKNDKQFRFVQNFAKSRKNNKYNHIFLFSLYFYNRRLNKILKSMISKECEHSSFMFYS